MISTADRVELLYRAGDVRRLHTVATTNTTAHTVAQHVYGSCCIAAELCRLAGASPAPVLLYLMYHDAPEVDTGDVPAPVKRAVPELGEQLDLLESAFYNKNNIEVPELNELEHDIAKAADILDLVFSCVRERRLGNSTPSLRAVFVTAQSYLDQYMTLPGVAALRSYASEEWSNARR